MVSPTFSFSGIASGLDTDAIVNSLMQLERLPIGRLNAQRADYNGKLNAWTSITTKLSDFRTSVDEVRSVADFNGFVSVTSSNEDAVTVSLDGSPTPSTLSVSIEQLAATHQVATGSGLPESDALVGAGTFTLSVDGSPTDFTTDAATTLDQLAAEISSAGLGVSASVIQVSQNDYRLLLGATESGASASFTASSDISAFGTIDTLAQGQDAIARLGDPITGLQLTRSTNVFTDVLDGLSFTARATTTTPVDITVARDADGAFEAIKDVFTSANGLLSEIESQTDFNAASVRGSPLTGDRTARNMVLTLQSALSELVPNGGEFTAIGQIGISIQRDGTYEIDDDVLLAALETDFDNVVSMFVQDTAAVNANLAVLATSSSTISGSYDVVVDVAPEIPLVVGSAYGAPAQDEDLTIDFGGTSVTVNVATGSDINQAITAINAGLIAAGLTAVLAELGDAAGSPAIQMSAPGAYGSLAVLTITNDQAFGLDGVTTGIDIVGSIGGQTTTGVGDVLAATSGDPNGLQVRVSATAVEVGGGGYLVGSVGTTRLRKSAGCLA
ncbi:MAG: flagellar filament capping protein FliD [Actinobacteria bacterium]|nr:flagellar filament capping protein FliD [Actinomycetota bacterium]